MKESNQERLLKVPQITIVFWIAKLITTAFGEAFSDYLFFNDFIGEHRAMLMGVSFLIICLIIQLSVKKYIPWIYWITVASVGVFGTMLADFIHKDLEMSLFASTSMFIVIQTVVIFIFIDYKHRKEDMTNIVPRYCQ